MAKNRLSLHYHPIDGLAAVEVHGNKKLLSFLSDTGVMTLEELAARCRVHKGQIYWLERTPHDALIEQRRHLFGHGPAFISLLNELLKNLGDDCELQQLER